MKNTIKIIVGIVIGTSASPKNLTMFSPDGTSFSCGVLNDGSLVCS